MSLRSPLVAIGSSLGFPQSFFLLEAVPLYEKSSLSSPARESVRISCSRLSSSD